MSSHLAIAPRERESIVQALRAGVVPKLGLRHIQVGRARELEAIVGDITRTSQGGAAMRFVIGDYGAGKTLLLGLSRLIALEKGLAVLNADLGPSRRLHARDGEARLLYGDLVASLATRTMPEGGAFSAVLDAFIAEASQDAGNEGVSLAELLPSRLAPLQELSLGFEFAAVAIRYGIAFEQNDFEAKSAALRWFRAEFSSRSEARETLGVRTIIDDMHLYDGLKLLARFMALAGYGGLLVALDEMVNLHKLNSAAARSANYEQILRMINDVLQGRTAHIAVLMGGTPEFLTDRRRGLYSYPALQSRLAQNRFAHGGADCSGPVIHLEPLTAEHLFVLLTKVRDVYQSCESGVCLPDAALLEFMDHCSKTLGDAYFRTPRHIVAAFLNMLAVLAQNPGLRWDELLEAEMRSPGGQEQPQVCPPESTFISSDHHDELASFRL